MGDSRALVALALLAGCGTSGAMPDAAADLGPDDQATPRDLTPGADLVRNACVPNPADDPITLAGFVIADYGGNPIPGAQVKLRRSADDSLVAQAIANATGHFSITTATGRTAIAGYLEVTDGNQGIARFYAADGFWQGNNGLELPVASEAGHAAGLARAGITYDKTRGIVSAAMRGCLDSIIGNATLTVMPASGTVYYYGANGDIDALATMTFPGNGLAGIANVDPGMVTLQGVAGPMPFKPVQVPSIAGISVRVLGMHFQ